MEKEKAILLLKYSAQRALLGEITPNLEAITIGFDEQLIKLIAYFKEQVSEEDKESISCVATEIIADFSEEFMIEEVCLSIDMVKLEMLDFWVFMKKQ